MRERVERIGDAMLMLADCRDAIAKMPDCLRFDALVTDPPYGVDFAGKTTKHTRATKESPGGYIGGDTNIGPAVVLAALEKVDRAVVFPGSRLMFEYPKPYEIGAVYCPSGAGLGRWGFTVFHPILFYGVGLPHTRQGQSGFESFDLAENCGHPCPKPIRWMQWAVNKCSTIGQTIFDPFMGSGTTGVACIQLGRKFVGIEIEPRYFDIACTRIEAAVREPRLGLPQPKPKQMSLLDGAA